MTAHQYLFIAASMAGRPFPHGLIRTAAPAPTPAPRIGQ
jgi:hypothetical protein